MYLQMNLSRKGVPNTYFQFSDIVFGYLLKTETVPAQVTFVGDYDDWDFSLFIDDHIEAAISFEAISFEAMFNFLPKYYFPLASFGSVDLASHNIFVFTDQRNFVCFTGDKERLQPSMKHKERIQHWPIPTLQTEIEAFLWLTSFCKFLFWVEPNMF